MSMQEAQSVEKEAGRLPRVDVVAGEELPPDLDAPVPWGPCRGFLGEPGVLFAIVGSGYAMLVTAFWTDAWLPLGLSIGCSVGGLLLLIGWMLRLATGGHPASWTPPSASAVPEARPPLPVIDAYPIFGEAALKPFPVVGAVESPPFSAAPSAPARHRTPSPPAWPLSRDLWQALWVLGGLAFLGRAFVHDAWEPAGLSALCTVLALEVRQSRRAGGAAVAAGFLTLGLAYVTGDAGAFMVSTACATLAVLHLVAERSRTRRGAVSPAPSARFDVPDAADAAVAVSGTVADLRASVGVVVSGIVLLCFGLWHPSDALGTVLFGASCGCTVGAIGLWTAARGQTMTAEDARVLRLEQSSRLNWQAALVAARRAPSETVAGRRDLRSTRTDRADPPVC